jgi:methylated-DNA-protein-cysteine methyltransferase-like protein
MAKTDNFFNSVYQVVRLIPKGRVTTYGAIAAYLGTKGSARMVGWAMNNSHLLGDVPAHRVVNKQGLLTGKHHFGSSVEMEQLLEAEGVAVKDNQVQNMETVFWDPNIALS